MVFSNSVCTASPFARRPQQTTIWSCGLNWFSKRHCRMKMKRALNSPTMPSQMMDLQATTKPSTRPVLRLHREFDGWSVGGVKVVETENSKIPQTVRRVSRSTSESAGPFCFRPPKATVSVETESVIIRSIAGSSALSTHYHPIEGFGDSKTSSQESTF